MAADPASMVFDLWWLWVLVAIFLAAIFLIAKKKRQKEYKEKPSFKTVKEYLDEKFKNFGRPMRGGKLYFGFAKSAGVRAFALVKGSFGMPEYNKDKKEFIPGTADAIKKKYSLLWLKIANGNFIFRWLHLGDCYFCLKFAEADGTPCLDMDHDSITLSPDADLMKYNKIWTNCHEGAQYVTDISMARMNEDAMTVIENFPALMSHLNAGVAFRERLATRGVELEKQKWKESEAAGDTTITKMEP